MTKERVCANSPAMFRRMMMTILPVAGVSCAAPLLAQEGTSEILRLFHAHRRITKAAHIYARTVSDQDEDLEMLFYRRTDRIQDAMMALPSSSAADFAAKMIISHCDGEFSCLSDEDPVWVEARQLTS